MSFKKKVIALSASLFSLAAILPIGSAHAETVLRLAHASSSSSLIHEAVTKFADEVKEKSGGDLTVQIFPDGQLGDEGPIADGVGAGSIDIGLGGVVDQIDPKLNVVTLPFLFAECNPRLERSNNFLPSLFSRRAMELLTPACVRPIRWAAAVKLPASTRAKASPSRCFIRRAVSWANYPAGEIGCSRGP